jgi:hypothetical protein
LAAQIGVQIIVFGNEFEQVHMTSRMPSFGGYESGALVMDKYAIGLFETILSADLPDVIRDRFDAVPVGELAVSISGVTIDEETGARYDEALYIARNTGAGSQVNRFDLTVRQLRETLPGAGVGNAFMGNDLYVQYQSKPQNRPDTDADTLASLEAMAETEVCDNDLDRAAPDHGSPLYQRCVGFMQAALDGITAAIASGDVAYRPGLDDADTETVAFGFFEVDIRKSEIV